MNIGRILSASPRRVAGILLLAALLLTACGGGTSESWAGVMSNSDLNSIYVSYDDHVVAVNPTNGATQWEYKDDGAKFFAVPTVADDTIYVGDYEGKLHAINAVDGERIWVYEPDRRMLIGPLALEAQDRVIGPAEVGPDYVYFGLGSRNMVAVSRETAEEVWTFETDHGVWTQPLYLPADADAGRDVDTVYVASLDHYFYAIDAVTGDEIWKQDMGGAAPGDMVYDAARNRAYIGTFISELLAIDLATGDIIARYETEDWLWGAPAFDDDVLYFGDLSGNLYAVRAADDGFEQVWEQQLAEDGIRSTPLVTENVVVVGAKDENVYAVSKEDGSERWDKKTEGKSLTNLVFVPEVPAEEDAEESTISVVVIGTDDQENLLVAYNIENGERSWRYNDN